MLFDLDGVYYDHYWNSGFHPNPSDREEPLLNGRLLTAPDADTAPDEELSEESWTGRWILLFRHLLNANVENITVDFVEPFLSILMALVNVSAGGDGESRPRFVIRVSDSIQIGMHSRYSYDEGEFAWAVSALEFPYSSRCCGCL